MMKKKSCALLLSLLASGSLFTLPAQADPAEQTLTGTPELRYYSRDGQTIYYYYTDSNGFGNFWTSALGTVFVGDIAGGVDAGTITDIAPDGSIAVGEGYGGLGLGQAFYWTSGTGAVAIPTIAGGTGQGRANAVSADGSTVTGYMINGSGDNETFYWTAGGGTVALGMAPGWTSHSGFDISDDGSAITGTGSYMGASHNAFHWNAVDGMTAIPLLPPGVNPSAYNDAEAISGDGLTVVGYNEYQNTGGEAFLWTAAGGTVGMGFLGTDDLSSATYVNYDGSMAYAYSWGSGPNGAIAFRWTSADGPVSINQLMTDAGIALGDLNIDYVWSASDDGNYLSGTATDSVTFAGINFIANLNSSTPGIVTPGGIAQSVGSMPALKEQGTQKTLTQIGQSLFAARLQPMIASAPSTQNFALSLPSTPADIAPAAGGNSSSFFSQPPRISGFIVGSLGAGQNNDLDNWGVNGLAGFKFALSDDFNIGLGINGSAARTNGLFASHSDITSRGGSLLTAYEPANGLRLYTSLFGAKLDIDTHREYDAGAIDSSEGETDGLALGGAVRLGYETPLNADVSLQPFLEAHVTHVKVDGYTETGGSFPATFSDQSETTKLGKVGIEGKYKFSPTLHLSGQLAYVRSSANDSSSVQTSVGGLTFTTDGNQGDKGWGEMTLGAQWSASESTQFSAELNARSGDTQAPQLNATVGLTYNF
jgi:uncharacterized protein YhjY with autotransporter beta-barrel domain/uncharacterized membrane protein